MINNYKELKEYIRIDKAAYQIDHLTLFQYLFNDCLRFQIRLRIVEWLYNSSKNYSIKRFFCILLQICNHHLASKLGLTIPKNVFGPGLCIVHYGTIVVSPLAKVGRNCRLHPSTCIGDFNGAPILGDNVYIGPGAKLFGNITIGNNVSIGANAVVNKSFGDNVTIGGIPAKVLNNKSSILSGVFPKSINILN